MAKNQKEPYKSRLFDMYIHWKSIPAIYRGSPAELMEKIGIDDSTALELMGLKTQAEFAAKFKVDIGTLSDWNKRINSKNLLKPFYSDTLKKVVSNAVASLAINQVKNPTPAGIRVLNDIAYKEIKTGKLSNEDGSELENTSGPRWSQRVSEAILATRADRILKAAYTDEEETPGTSTQEKLERIAKLIKSKN